VGGRVKPGHDGGGGRGKREVDAGQVDWPSRQAPPAPSITLHQLAPTLAGRHPRARPGDPCCGAPFAAGVFAPPSPAEMPDGWSGH